MQATLCAFQLAGSRLGVEQGDLIMPGRPEGKTMKGRILQWAAESKIAITDEQADEMAEAIMDAYCETHADFVRTIWARLAQKMQERG